MDSKNGREPTGSPVEPHPSSRRTFALRRVIGITVAFLVVPAIAFLAAFATRGTESFYAKSHAFFQLVGVATVLKQPRVYPDPPYTLFSTRVVLPSHSVAPAYVTINKDGTIRAVQTTPLVALFASSGVIVDASPLVVMPGLIDPHVHVNAPGRESWEGFDNACKAAAAGGTTTILDMPLNNVPSTVDAEALAKKVRSLEDANCIVDVGLIGGIIPSSIDKVSELTSRGVVALKSFMVDSQSKDFPNLSKDDLVKAIAALDKLARSSTNGARAIPYILHAELDGGLEGKSSRASESSDYDHASLAAYEAKRPPSWELNAAEFAVIAANNSKVHIHVAHVSAHEVVQFLSDLRSAGNLNEMTLTAETCPHYLLWANEEIPRGGTLFKCSPPIRSAVNRQQLLKSVLARSCTSNAIDLIASDHSPCPTDLKAVEGNVTRAWGGISGLQYRLQGTWTAASRIHANVVKLVELLAEGPARTFALDSRKGFLKEGFDADVVIWDPEARAQLAEDSCQHRHRASPYHGMRARGVVYHTLLRGTAIASRGNDVENVTRFVKSCKGRLLIRSDKDGSISSISPAEWGRVFST